MLNLLFFAQKLNYNQVIFYLNKLIINKIAILRK